MQQDKMKKSFCDYCKFYSYNDDSIRDKTDLKAWCHKFEQEVAPWDKCSEFRSK